MGPNARESLQSKSQRILGISLDDGEEKTARTRSSTGTAGNRREQVVQAQRTHRQRSQRYIRELENEVLRLRKSEESTREKNRVLQEQNALLRHSLKANQVPLPTPPSSISSASSVRESEDDFSNTCSHASPTVNIDLSHMLTLESAYGCPNTAAERIPTDVDLSLLTADDLIERDSAEVALKDEQGVIRETIAQAPAVLDAQNGINFILALEHPCLPHVKYSMERDLDLIHPETRNHWGPAHVFTATAAVVSAQENLDISHPFTMPQDEIDRLLDASRRLDLENEMTPVQVWQEIQEYAKYNSISTAQVDVLKKDFCKYTFCNSFGTVIDKSVVDVIFNYHLNPSTFSAPPKLRHQSAGYFEHVHPLSMASDDAVLAS